MNNKELYNKIVKIIDGDKNAPQLLEEIKKELETEIITNGKINNSIKQAFKRLQKENDIRPKFQNVLRNGNNNFSITNGYFIITYTAEQLPEELKAYINPNEKEINDGLQFEKLKNTNELNLLSLNFKLMEKVYKYNKLNKRKNVFTLQNGYTFNLQYFVDILSFLNYKDISNITLEIDNTLIHPINILSKNGNGILLPTRATEEQISEQLKLQDELLKEI